MSNKSGDDQFAEVVAKLDALAAKVDRYNAPSIWQIAAVFVWALLVFLTITSVLF